MRVDFFARRGAPTKVYFPYSEEAQRSPGGKGRLSRLHGKVAGGLETRQGGEQNDGEDNDEPHERTYFRARYLKGLTVVRATQIATNVGCTAHGGLPALFH